MNNLFNWKDNCNEIVLAFSLVFPVYILIFFGLKPLTQGLAYLTYFIPIIFYCSRKIPLRLPKKFVFLWVLFLFLWVTPSLLNFYSGKLESDLVKLPALLVHVVYMSVMIWTFAAITQSESSDKKNILVNTLGLVSAMLLPLALLIFFYGIYLKVWSEVNRPLVFSSSPHFLSEVSLIFVFSLVWVRSIRTKVLIYVMTLFFLTFVVETRSTLLAFSVFVFLLSIIPRWKNLIKLFFRYRYGWIPTLLVIPFVYKPIVAFVSSTLYLNSAARGWNSGLTGRVDVWIKGLHSIHENPLLGLGYWVSPYGYQLDTKFSINNPNFDIHNAWIRIAVENGLPLFTFICILILATMYKIEKFQDHYSRAIFYAIIIFLCLTTRHLTINLLNMVFYFVAVFVLMRNKKK